MISGIITGLFFGEYTAILKPFGDAFIKIWQITVLPTVAISLIAGTGSLKSDEVKKIVIKVGLVLMMFWAIGIAIFFSLPLAFPNLGGAFFSSVQNPIQEDNLSLADLFIPSNPFQSLSDGLIPAIVVFCLLIGFSLTADKNSWPILSSLKVLQGAVTRITGALSMTFPIGIFIITAETYGSMTIEGFLQLQVYIISLAVAAILLTLGILPLLITCFTTFRYRDIIFTSSSALILAFSTGSSFIILPLIIEGVRNLFGYDSEKPERGPDDDNNQNQYQDQIQYYSEILVPLGYTFPLLGSMVPFLFILFVAWLYNNPLGLSEQIKLIAVGIPDIFGSSKVSVISLLNLMHLPSNAYNLYISTGLTRQRFEAPLTSMSIFSFTTISIVFLANKYRIRWKRMILVISLTLLFFALMLSGLKIGFALLLANSHHGNDLFSNIELPPNQDGKAWKEVVNTVVYLRPEEAPVLAQQDSAQADEIKAIKNRGVLRVGYNSSNIPFVFFNSRGDLVGYDVQMAYELAKFINISRIEFVPVTGDNLAESLNQGYCDIAMSSILVTSERLNEMKFTDPYISVHMAFVVPDYRKKEFLKLDDVRRMNNLRIAVINHTALVGVARQMFPQAKIVLIDSWEDFFTESSADVLLTTSEEGYVMIRQHPLFNMAIFEPNDYFPMLYAYPVKKNSSDTFIMLLNYWLKMEKDYGGLDDKYNYWILGNSPGAVEPRWSVVRNVLNWTS